MRFMMKKQKVFLVFILFLLTTGCAVTSGVINDDNNMTAGFDLDATQEAPYINTTSTQIITLTPTITISPTHTPNATLQAKYDKIVQFTTEEETAPYVEKMNSYFIDLPFLKSMNYARRDFGGCRNYDDMQLSIAYKVRDYSAENIREEVVEYLTRHDFDFGKWKYTRETEYGRMCGITGAKSINNDIEISVHVGFLEYYFDHPAYEDKEQYQTVRYYFRYKTEISEDKIAKGLSFLNKCEGEYWIFVK